MPMATRATVGGHRVMIESYQHEGRTFWQWRMESRVFRTSAEAYADATATLGPGVSIAQDGVTGQQEREAGT